MTRTDDLMTELLGLPVRERAKIARALLESLDAGAPDPDAEEAWAEELARRVRSIEDGTAKLHSWDEVRERVQSRLREIRDSR